MFNVYGIIPNRFIFRSLLCSVLFAGAIAGFAQTPELAAAKVTADTQPGAAVGKNTNAETNAAAEKPAASAPGAGMSQSDMSREIVNPLSNLWALQFQQNNNRVEMPFGKGNYSQSGLQFQPLLPINLSKHWNWITRPVIGLYDSSPYPTDVHLTGINMTTTPPTPVLNANMKR